MTWLLWILVIIAVILALKNVFKSKSLVEEIDDLRGSYIDLRKSIKETKDLLNARAARLELLIRREKGEIKDKVIPYRITEECISCGSCKPECPVDAIAEGEPYVIDIEKCTACGACARVCPVEACVPIS